MLLCVPSSVLFQKSCYFVSFWRRCLTGCLRPRLEAWGLPVPLGVRSFYLFFLPITFNFYLPHSPNVPHFSQLISISYLKPKKINKEINVTFLLILLLLILLLLHRFFFFLLFFLLLFLFLLFFLLLFFFLDFFRQHFHDLIFWKLSQTLIIITKTIL